MMIRRIQARRYNRSGPPRRALFLALAGLWLAVSVGAGPARAEGSAAKFVRLLGETAVRELAPNDITEQQRETRFRELLHEKFDVPRITRFALGRYARRATKEELKKFAALYEDLAVLTYAHMFATYAGQGFTVKKELGAPGDKYLMVVSEVSKPDGSLGARLDWQVLVRKSNFAVVDIRVEGVSMAITQRDDFTAFLDKNGGDMPTFLAELAGRVKKLREERTTQ